MMSEKYLNLFLISLICLFTLPVLAQKKIEKGETTISSLQEGEFSINNRNYSVEKAIFHDKVLRVTIYHNIEFIQKLETKPSIKSIRQNGAPSWISIRTSYEQEISNAILDVLGIPLITEYFNEKVASIIMHLYTDYTGKIKATKFTLNGSNYPVTMGSLHQIVSTLEKNILFKVPENINPDQKIHPVAYNIRFRNLLRASGER